jgi:YVTN family beta-propeller protein
MSQRPTTLLARSIFLSGLLLACGGDRSKPSATGDSTTAADSTATAAPVRTEGLAYVSNEGSQELTVIDTRTDSAVATIPVGTRPRGVKVSPDGKLVYVALSGSPRCPPKMPDAECEKMVADKSKDGIAEVDATTRKVKRIFPGGSDPETFDLSRDGTRLFISNEDAGTATILDTGSGNIVATIKVGTEPEGVQVHPDGKTVWVTGETAQNITVISTDSGRILGQIHTEKRPRGVAFTPDGLKAYVTCEVGGVVQVVDVRQRKVIATIRPPAGSLPMGVVAAPDGKRVYFSTGRGGKVMAVDVATNKIVGGVDVGKRPWGIALSGDASKLYSANGPSNDVAVVATDSMKLIKTIPAGQLPWGVAVAK